MKRGILSAILALSIILSLSTTAFAARRFSLEKFHSLPTWEAKSEYVLSVDKWYSDNTNYSGKNPMPPDVDADYVDLAKASIWLNENPPGATTKLTEDVSDRIAAIKAKYGIEFTIGGNENGKYHKDAKIGPHLTNIETGLSFMGAKLTKWLADDFESSKLAQSEKREVGHVAPWRAKFRINLTPKQDIYNTDGTLEGLQIIIVTVS